MIKSLIVGLLGFVTASTAFAQEGGVTQAPLPRSIAAPVRIIPVMGASSFSTTADLGDLKFDQGFSAGILGDFGSKHWTFETGILSLNSRASAEGETTAFSVNTWGIPLLAKLNFSGHPHQTVFLKGGVMPFTASGDKTTDFDVLGVAGIGGNVPLGRSTSIMLDASYNRMFTRGGDLTDYQGVSLLAGLSLNI